MSTSPIIELFLNESDKIDKEIVSDEYKRLFCRYAELEEELLDTVKDIPEAKNIYQELSIIESQLDTESSSLYYKEGFKRGLSLSVDALFKK